MLVGRLKQHVDLNLAANRSMERPDDRIDLVGDKADEKQPSLRGFNDFAENLLGVPDRNLTRRGACPHQFHGPTVLSQDRRRRRSLESGCHVTWRGVPAMTPRLLQTSHQFFICVGAETRTSQSELLDGTQRLDL